MISPPWVCVPHGKVRVGPSLGTSVVDLELGPQGNRPPKSVLLLSSRPATPTPLPVSSSNPPKPVFPFVKLVGPLCRAFLPWPFRAQGAPRISQQVTQQVWGGVPRNSIFNCQSGQWTHSGKDRQRTVFRKKKTLTFADFHGVNTHSMANFRYQQDNIIPQN